MQAIENRSSWWRADPSHLAMVHVHSGEAVIYRGSDGCDGKHVLEYQHEGKSVVVRIRTKDIEYPHPSPDRYAYEYRVNLPKAIRSHTWLADYRGEIQDMISPLSPHAGYSLWKRIDAALRDVALVWDPALPGLELANEFGAIGGYLNGSWSARLYRRFGWSRDMLDSIAAGFIEASDYGRLGPLAYSPPASNHWPPKWDLIQGHVYNIDGEPTTVSAPEMRNEFTGNVIAEISAEGRPPFKSAKLMTFKTRDWFGNFLIWFSRADESAASGRERSFDMWSSEIWRVSASQGGKKTRSKASRQADHPSSTSELTPSADEQAASYIEIAEQVEALENVLPIFRPVQPEGETPESVARNSRLVEITDYPIAGRPHGIASIRLELQNTALQRREGWVQMFDGMQ
ncbi:MAG: hypothetical protein HYU58_19595 [Proteobacteria bacterium]|nr:hypothetical protein [Pseudomonadota bacterium]